MADSKTILEEERFYHIYNHTVGNESLFKTERNYYYFLSLIKKYLIAYVDIYAYCLMPNHFHLVIKTKSELEILDAYNQQKPSKTNSSIYMILSNRFSNLFNSYAQAYNSENNRKGSLFFNRFKRKIVIDEKYLVKLIHYLHYNPIEAGLAKNIEDWKFSSYKAY